MRIILGENRTPEFVNATNEAGVTSLDLALASGLKSVARLLQEHGAVACAVVVESQEGKTCAATCFVPSASSQTAAMEAIVDQWRRKFYEARVHAAAFAAVQAAASASAVDSLVRAFDCSEADTRLQAEVVQAHCTWGARHMLAMPWHPRCVWDAARHYFVLRMEGQGLGTRVVLRRQPCALEAGVSEQAVVERWMVASFYGGVRDSRRELECDLVESLPNPALWEAVAQVHRRAGGWHKALAMPLHVYDRDASCTVSICSAAACSLHDWLGSTLDTSAILLPSRVWCAIMGQMLAAVCALSAQGIEHSCVGDARHWQVMTRHGVVPRVVLSHLHTARVDHAPVVEVLLVHCGRPEELEPAWEKTLGALGNTMVTCADLGSCAAAWTDIASRVTRVETPIVLAVFTQLQVDDASTLTLALEVVTRGLPSGCVLGVVVDGWQSASAAPVVDLAAAMGMICGACESVVYMGCVQRDDNDNVADVRLPGTVFGCALLAAFDRVRMGALATVQAVMQEAAHAANSDRLRVVSCTTCVDDVRLSPRPMAVAVAALVHQCILFGHCTAEGSVHNGVLLEVVHRLETGRMTAIEALDTLCAALVCGDKRARHEACRDLVRSLRVNATQDDVVLDLLASFLARPADETCEAMRIATSLCGYGRCALQVFRQDSTDVAVDTKTVLGHGACSQVLAATGCEGEIAVKALCGVSKEAVGGVRALWREGWLLQGVGVAGIPVKPPLLLMGMLCSDGDLQLVLRRAQSDLASAVGTLTREQWATIAMHVLQDLASLHALGWTHGDMQSTNVLVHVESGRATGWLCDLSCAEPALTGAATAVDVYGWATVFRQAFAACAHPADAAGAAGAADAANSFATALLSVTKAIIAKRAACCSAASLLRKLESLQTL